MTYGNRFRCDPDHTLRAQYSFTDHSMKPFLKQKAAAVQDLGVRILVVEDYANWSHFICSTLEQKQELRVVCAVSNGLDAIEKAGQLKPDLILLDIGLPELNGIEAARRIRAFDPQSKIIFVSENRDRDIIHEALSTGACGYVLKSLAGRELLSAVEVVLRGGTFISDHLAPSGH
jgi:DNA-binding NarL/FixJ family response regulator